MDTQELEVDNLTGINHEGNYINTPPKYLTASSIIGDEVHDEAKEHIGDIKDIMLDIATGKIDYLVIETGGLLGIGTKYFATPFNLLSIDPENKSFLFNGTKEKFENAPGFDKDHWPDTNAMQLVYDYWSFI
ncbi:PRC-barrel domain-containing protein [Parasediminibacterium sp. JCM 36343]|uniref:PRC-barrel domain-containing protein n=1 Tax=Parasediminibacterium sp. JCM 36343 TaxID=3374279 RepID=UPI003979DAC4